MIRHKYQPIRNKQKEQEAAVKKFKDTEHVRRGLEGKGRRRGLEEKGRRRGLEGKGRENGEGDWDRWLVPEASRYLS